MTQKWKQDPSLYDAPTEKKGVQVKKKLDYGTTYVEEFLNCDPLRDWESIDRCKWLWDWSLGEIDNVVDVSDWRVLDVGSKDGQFPEWLREMGVLGLGIEISEPYVKYATAKGRPVMMGNACCMSFADYQFDYVFSHHLHGLLPDYMKGLQEMFRVSKRYMIALNQVPGNPRKHYSYIENADIYHEFVESVDCNVIYNDYLDTGFNNEWVIFLEKKLPEGAFHGPDMPKPDFDVSDAEYESIERSIERIDEEAEIVFKRKKK